ncbi:MAG: helix-turn-helix transcriptional regulator [Lachnospiraceae bacterium]|nr:helix-turn-helix transcriptional regulator [Lachnospiraceae bacterium]
MRKIDNSTMGGRVKEQRIKMGMTQEELAEKMFTTKAAISQYENNKVDIKGSMIVELAGILDTAAGYLLNKEVGVEDMDEQMKEMMVTFKSLRDEKIRQIALEQMKNLSEL